LFFSSSALVNVLLSGKDINEWLLTLMGYAVEKDLILSDIKGHGTGNFYLIIDGLDEHLFKSEDFHVIINQLSNIFSFYQSDHWFKLIITMRSANWINNRHLLDFESKKWFTGYFKDNRLTTNVPLLSVSEIRQLCKKINPSVPDLMSIDVDVANNFNHPLYFQYYYKQNKDNFSLNRVNQVCIYETISGFILSKVYLGQKAAEKMLLLNGLINAMDLQNQRYDLDILKVNGLIKEYPQAYHELLGAGFLNEVNLSQEHQFSTIVQFGEDHFLEYALATKLLFDNEKAFNQELIDQIDQLFNNSIHKLPVLKWCIMHHFKTGTQHNFDILMNARLSPIEKSSILIFLGDLLEHNFSDVNDTGAIAQGVKPAYSDKLFNYFFGLEFIDIGHKQNLLTLLKLKLFDHQKILVYTGLASIAIIEFNMVELETSLKRLKGFSSESFHSFMIDPLHCLDAIHQFLKYGAIKKDFFAELTRFYFNNTLQEERLKSKVFHTLINLLAAFSLQICQPTFKILRFTHSLRYLINTSEDLFAYCFFLNILEADSYFHLGQKQKFLNSYNFILSSTESTETLFTPMMNAMLYNLKIKAAIINEDYPLVASYYDYLSEICTGSGNKLIKTMASVAILGDQNLTTRYPQLIKQVNYEYLKILRENGLSINIFMTNDIV